MKISDILKIESIRLNYAPLDKFDLLMELLNLAKASNNIVNFDIVKKELFEREAILSTGVGKGIALPHCKTSHVKKMTAALIINSDASDYDSLDKLPVRLFFLLLSRADNVGAHLRMLSQVSRLVHNHSLTQNLLEAKEPQKVIHLIEKFDLEYKN